MKAYILTPPGHHHDDDWRTSPPRLIGGFRETEAIYTAKLAGVWKPFHAFGRRPSKSIWHASRLAETFAVHFGGVLVDEMPGSFASVRDELRVRE